MARNSDGTPKTVKLKDPQGNEVNVSLARDVVNLVYGSGYKLVGHKSVEEATDFLSREGVEVASGTVAEQQAAEAAKAASGDRGQRH